MSEIGVRCLGVLVIETNFPIVCKHYVAGHCQEFQTVTPMLVSTPVIVSRYNCLKGGMSYHSKCSVVGVSERYYMEML